MEAKPLNSPRWWLRKILGGAAGGLAGMIAVRAGTFFVLPFIAAVLGNQC